MELRVKHVLEATGGRLLQGDPEGLLVGVSTDSRTLPPGALFVALKGQRYDGHDFAREAVKRGARGVMVHKEVEVHRPVAVILVEETLRGLGDLAAWWRKGMGGHVVGITGSCGKTTTKEMVLRALGKKGAFGSPGNYNNLIGLPLSLLQAPKEAEVVVLEMGMSRPGEIARLSRIARPTVGVITMVGPVHLEGFGSLEGIREAKAEILEGMDEGGVLVFNADDPLVEEISQRFPGRKLPFGLRGEALVRPLEVVETERGLSLRIETPQGPLSFSLEMVGQGAVTAALAATGAALAAGATPEEIAEGLDGFRPLKGRMQVLEVGPLHVIDDSYNANPPAVEAALKVLVSRPGGRKVAVLGDMAELGEGAAGFHRRVGRLCAELGLDALFLLGDLAEEVASGARQEGFTGELYRGKDHEELASALKRYLEPGDWVLVKGSRVMETERVIEALRRRQR